MGEEVAVTSRVMEVCHRLCVVVVVVVAGR